MSDTEIIITADGSHSLRNRVMDETYHSVHGAVQESLHVFIKSGLDFLMGQSHSPDVRILEMGLGTGLNAFLTCRHVAEGKQKIFYTSVEAFPLEEDVWSKLNYADSPDLKSIFARLHQVSWESFQSLSPNFQIRKVRAKMQEMNLEPESFDLVYYDAFAPSKQPEMWELPILKNVADSMKPGGVFVTYCAKGQLKRDLVSVGLKVETLQGPPGKKEMIRAHKA